jgi:hypothetical protein
VSWRYQRWHCRSVIPNTVFVTWHQLIVSRISNTHNSFWVCSGCQGDVKYNGDCNDLNSSQFPRKDESYCQTFTPNFATATSSHKSSMFVQGSDLRSIVFAEEDRFGQFRKWKISHLKDELYLFQKRNRRLISFIKKYLSMEHMLYKVRKMNLCWDRFLSKMINTGQSHLDWTTLNKRWFMKGIQRTTMGRSILTE